MNKYTGKYFSDAVKEKAELSRREVADMVDRAVRCPFCNIAMLYAYTDLAGHFSIKCPRCNQISDISLEYFYKQKESKTLHGMTMLPPFA